MEMSDKPEIHHKRKISPIQQQTVIPADFLSDLVTFFLRQLPAYNAYSHSIIFLYPQQ